jgi:hypothetical protein
MLLPCAFLESQLIWLLPKQSQTVAKPKLPQKLKKKFTASYTEYSMEQFINFLKDTNIGLSSLTSANIAADAAF